MTGGRIIFQQDQVLQQISLAMAAHGSTEAQFGVKQQVTKVVCSNSTKSIRNCSQTFSMQRKKLHINFAILLSFIFIDLSTSWHWISLLWCLTLMRSVFLQQFLSIKVLRSTQTHYSWMKWLPDGLQLLMSVRSLGPAKFELIQSHASPKTNATTKCSKPMPGPEHHLFHSTDLLTCCYRGFLKL